MKPLRTNPLLVYDLKKELQAVRRNAFEASREGNYLKVAKLTYQAGRLTRSIMEAEGQTAFSHF